MTVTGALMGDNTLLHMPEKNVTINHIISITLVSFINLSKALWRQEFQLMKT